MSNASKNGQSALLKEPKGEFEIPPVRHLREPIKDPYQVLENFFIDYPIDEFQKSFGQLVTVGLTTDNVEYAEAEERANLMSLYWKTSELTEAAQMIIDKRNSKKKSNG